MHEGVPPGGALWPAALAAGNRAVGNPAGAAAIELVGSLRLTAHGAPVVVAAHGAPARRLEPGDHLDVSAGAARVVYLAIQGGLDVPRVLGGRGTLLAAALGGHHGRLLRRGDVLPVGAHGAPWPTDDPARHDEATGPHAADGALLVRATPGPDLDRFPPDALAALAEATLVVSPVGDRTGQRLVLPPDRPAGGASAWAPLRGGTAPSAPMVRGAVQVTPSGELIVMGPDHPTTGGYPVALIVPRAAQGPLAAARVGTRVRLVIAG
jgi:allophanate hydrolase subunit 2